MRARGVIVLGGRPTQTSFDPDAVPFRQRTRSQQLELTDAQIVELMKQLPGVEMLVEHGRSSEWGASRVGHVVRAFHDENGNACVEFELLDSPEAVRAARAIRDGTLRDLSLAHNAVTGKPLEVSLCKAGARNGTHITDVLGSAEHEPETAHGSYKEPQEAPSQCCVVWASNTVRWIADMDATLPNGAPEATTSTDQPIANATAAAAANGTPMGASQPVVNAAASKFEQLGHNTHVNEQAKANIARALESRDGASTPAPSSTPTETHSGGEASHGNWLHAILQKRALTPEQQKQMDAYLRSRLQTSSTTPPPTPPAAAPAAPPKPRAAPTNAAERERLAARTAATLSQHGIDPLSMGVSAEMWAQEAEDHGGHLGPRATSALSVAFQLAGSGHTSATGPAKADTAMSPPLARAAPARGQAAPTTSDCTNYIMDHTNAIPTAGGKNRGVAAPGTRDGEAMDVSPTEDQRTSRVRASAMDGTAVGFLPENMYQHVFAARPTEHDRMALRFHTPPSQTTVVLATSGLGWERVEADPAAVEFQSKFYNYMVDLWDQFQQDPQFAARCELAAQTRIAAVLAQVAPQSQFVDSGFPFTDPGARAYATSQGTSRPGSY